MKKEKNEVVKLERAPIQDEFISQVLSRIESSVNITNPNLFNIDYKLLPDMVYHRKQFGELVQNLLEFVNMGMREHLIVLGTRGSGKTALIDYAIEQIGLKYNITKYYVNCRQLNSSYKILKEFCKEKMKVPYDDLRQRFLKDVQANADGKIFLVLDEIDLMKDDNLFYDITRNNEFSNVFMIMITKTPKFYQNLSSDVKSSLNQKFLFFDTYAGSEVFDILKKRAMLGLKKYNMKLIGKIAQINTKQFNSDVRLGIKVMGKIFKNNEYTQYNDDTIKEIMLGEDIVIKDGIIQNLNEIKLAVLYYIIKNKKSTLAYKDFCANNGYEISKGYFYQFVDELTSLDLFYPQKIRVGRSHIYEYHPKLYNENMNTIKMMMEQKGGK